MTPLLDTIYVDLDGVLAGFDEHMLAVFGIMKEQMLSSAERWDRINQYEAAGHEWFLELPIKPDAMLMMSELRELVRVGLAQRIAILTATGNDFWKHSDQKYRWCKRYGVSRLCDTFIAVPKAECKQFYANPRSVLIDDHWERCVKPFIDQGGIGIHHLQPELSMLKLTNHILHLKGVSDGHG